MKPPICRVCGVAHWGRDPHVFKGEVVANTEPVVANESSVVVDNTPAPAKGRHGVYKDKGRRLAYMRDLMRKRRGK